MNLNFDIFTEYMKYYFVYSGCSFSGGSGFLQTAEEFEFESSYPLEEFQQHMDYLPCISPVCREMSDQAAGSGGRSKGATSGYDEAWEVRAFLGHILLMIALGNIHRFR